MEEEAIEIIDDDAELFEHYKFTADKGQQFLRVDKFLSDRLPNASRNKIQQAVSDGNVLVNGEKVKSNYKVKPLDEVKVVLEFPPREIELIPENIPINIVYEDDEVIIVNKKAGMVVHPGFGNYTGTLVNALIYHFENLPKGQGEFPRPGLVHRIDKNTTGLMIIAKTAEAMNYLAKQFFDHTIERLYEAIVWGSFEENAGVIEGNVGRNLKNRKIMQVFTEEEEGKQARTHFKVLKDFDYVSVVQCKLETGRTHQIRVHMKYAGHPLFGDPEYGGDRILKGTTFSKYKQFIENCFQILPRQALHAKTLGFIHPKTKEKMHFTSDLPEDMQQVLEKFERYIGNR